MKMVKDGKCAEQGPYPVLAPMPDLRDSIRKPPRHLCGRLKPG
jgi:hypothetical protein